MTISSSTRKAGPFNGNDVTTVFPFTFKVFAVGDIALTLTDADGVETALVLNTDYTVVLNADQDDDPGGDITYPVSGAPLATGEKLTVVGDLAELQPTELTNGGGFFPKVIERAFDRVVIFAQQLREQVNRSVKFPASDEVDGVELPVAALRANKALVFDADGNVGVSTDDFNNSATAAAASAAATAALYDLFDDRYLGSKVTDPLLDNDGDALVEGTLYWNSIAQEFRLFNGAEWQIVVPAGNLQKITYTAGVDYTAGVTTTLTLPTNPLTKSNLDIVFDAAWQQMTEFELSGTTVTFDAPIPVGVAQVEVSYTTPLQISEPSDGTVTDAKVAAGAGIESSKLNFTAAGAGVVAQTVQATLRNTVNISGWGGSMALALTDLGNVNRVTLEITSAVTLAANTTIPRNVSLYIKDGGSINQGAFTLTINGPFRGGWYCIFTGSGAVTFGPATVYAVSPLWWRENTTPGTTDMQPALAAAVASLRFTDGASKIELPPDRLLLGSQLDITTPVMIYGAGCLISYDGRAQTELIKPASMSGPAIITTGANIHLSDFALIGVAGNTGDGIQILSNGCTLTRIRSNRMGQDGIRIGSDLSGNNSNQWAMYSCIANENGRYGLHCHDVDVDCNGGTSVNLTVQLNASDGLHIGKSQVNVWVGTLAEFNSGWGCQVDPGVNLQTLQTFTGGDYEANTLGQFRLATTAFLNYVQVHCVVVDLATTGENTIVTLGDITAPRITAKTLTVSGESSAVPTYQRITHSSTNASNRNYAWQLTKDAFGDFALMQSAASGGDAGDGTGRPILQWQSIAAPAHISGTAPPSVGVGINGDFFYNGNGGAMTTVYHKRAGAWVGIV